MRKNKIVIIIPCFNEGNTIYKIYKKASRYGKVLIVDDGSSDNSREILYKKKIKFLKNNQNIGYEASIIKGIKYILKNYKYIKYVATIDADGELLPKFIPILLRNLIKSDLDIIIGSRNTMNRFSEHMLKFIFNIKFNIDDPISGLKIYKLNVLRKIINQISNKHFLVDIIIISYYYEFKIGFCKTKVDKRKGRAKVGGNFLMNIKILKIIFSTLLKGHFPLAKKL